MSKTLSDVLTSLSYRLGESSVPSDASERARRIRYINEGYRNLISRGVFWFTEDSSTESTVADQEAYSLPSDFRIMIEVRVDDKVYTPISQKEAFSLYDSTYQYFNYDDVVSNKHFYIFNNEIHILPAPSAIGVDNISFKFYNYPTEVSADSDTFVIPDFFSEALVSYAYARVCMLDDKRGNASDGMNEFEEIYLQLVRESNRNKFKNKSVRPIDPSMLSY